MDKAKLDRITDDIDEVNKRYWKRLEKKFAEEGVTADEYYTAFWKDWLERDRARQAEIEKDL